LLVILSVEGRSPAPEALGLEFRPGFRLGVHPLVVALASL
jgi:hypothetical protein